MRTFFYFFLLAITCIGALFSQITYSYVPFLLVCSWGIIALLYRGFLKSIQFTARHMEDNSIELTFKQKWRVPFHVRYEVTYEHFISNESQTVHGSFFTNERVHVEKIQLDSAFCGQLVLKNLRLIYLDSLAFASVKAEEKPSCRVFQMPAITFTEASASTSASSIVMGTETGAKERFTAYMPGDSVASIHWAMSARTQSLIVRKEAFAAEQNVQGVALYFNDVSTIEEYDAYMVAYYNLLKQQQYMTVYVWEQGWVVYDVSNLNDINQLFQRLFLVPLQQLYAHTPPPTDIISVQLEGGYGQ